MPSSKKNLIALPAAGLYRTVPAIIDTPQGSRNKYKYDRELGLSKVAVAVESPEDGTVMDLRQRSPALLDEIGHFFISYNAATGKEFKPIGSREAQRLLKANCALFRQTKAK